MKLIINADDYGLSRSGNCGIIEGHKKGVITSATLMANMPGFLDAVGLAKKNPDLGVGVHLNLYRGEPLSSPASISSLLRADGNFFASPRLVRKIYLKRINPKEVQKELKTQIIKVKEAGIAITHLDSEKHFHVFPVISSVVIRLAKYFNIRKIRLPDEKWQTRKLGDLFSPQFYKRQYLARRSRVLTPFCKGEGIKHVDQFYGILYSDSVSLQSFLDLLEGIPSGLSELMVHPGYIDEELRKISRKLNYSMIDSREKELKILLHSSVLGKIRELNIDLVNYREL